MQSAPTASKRVKVVPKSRNDIDILPSLSLSERIPTGRARFYAVHHLRWVPVADQLSLVHSAGIEGTVRPRFKTLIAPTTSALLV